MNGAVLLFLSIFIFSFFYFFYGRYLKKIFGVNPDLKTPAHKLKDGIDYVPANFMVLFGHHFASIAGAGPIVGPVLAACFGWGPVFIWIIFGCVFVGAVHDFAALFVSVRDKGLSIGHVIEKYLSYQGRQIFLLFCFASLTLVVSIFAILVAKTFVNLPSTATSSILFVFIAPAFGFFVKKQILSLKNASFIFVPIVFICIYIGVLFPLDLTAFSAINSSLANKIWLLVLFLYVFIASVIPVWMLLQPRDYLNSFLLYAMIIVGVLSIVIAGPELKLSAFKGFNVIEPVKNAKWNLFPLLFVTVACGACSGFHALVSSGTTSKQISSENHILPIGYGAMLIEGILAVMALISVAILSDGEFSEILSQNGPVRAFASGIGALSVKIKIPSQIGENFVALTISAFMLTTLDTATRLTRFVVQEISLPKSNNFSKPGILRKTFSNRYFSTFFAVAISLVLALSGGGSRMWPVFGASNQLLAALTLFLISVIFIEKNENFLIVFLPFLFMMVMSFWALKNLLIENIKIMNIPIILSIVFLMIMATLMIIIALKKIYSLKKKKA